MAKKIKKQKSQKKFIGLIIISFILLIISLNLPYPKFQQNSEALPTPTPNVPTPTDTPKEIIVDKITFSLPFGWTQEPFDYNTNNKIGENVIRLNSNDYKDPESHQDINFPLKGVSIIIKFNYFENPTKIIDDELNSPSKHPYLMEKNRIRIDNKEGVSSFYKPFSNAGFHRLVEVANGNKLWKFDISAKDYDEYRKHEENINKFLSSIKFID